MLLTLHCHCLALIEMTASGFLVAAKFVSLVPSVVEPLHAVLVAQSSLALETGPASPLSTALVMRLRLRLVAVVRVVE